MIIVCRDVVWLANAEKKRGQTPFKRSPTSAFRTLKGKYSSNDYFEVMSKSQTVDVFRWRERVWTLFNSNC